MTPPARPQVAVLAAPTSGLAAALRAALAGRGWVVRQPQQLLGPGIRAVVVVEDDTGSPWPPPRPLRAERTIGIGSLRSADVLASLASRGATVLDQDVPFLTLLRLIETALLADAPTSRRGRRRAASAVRERATEARALAGLSERERTVLCGLVRGLSAAAIAEEGSRSLATVRTQIQSLTRRLGVRSQVAAVAAVHRSGQETPMGPCLEALHQF